MKIRRQSYRFELKSLDSKGAFAGYGSVFNNTDSYRDVVKPGAFEKSLDKWKAKGKLPPVLWQHDTRQPLGPHTMMKEDEKGLYVEGLLLIDDVPKAREAYALTKAKAIDGMSIGYNPVMEEYDGETNVNNLTEIDLWEVSIVTFPANVDARVEQVKNLLQRGDLPTLAEFEDLLRDVAGFSRSQAKTVASYGLKKLLDARDVHQSSGSDLILDEEQIKEVLALLEKPIK